MSILKFSIYSLAGAILLVVLVLMLSSIAGVEWPWIPIVSAVFLVQVTTTTAYAIAFTGLLKDARQFTGFLLGSMMIKMMIGIASILLVALLFKPFLKPYVIMYFISYFIFTSFEVYSLILKLRQQN